MTKRLILSPFPARLIVDEEVRAIETALNQSQERDNWQVEQRSVLHPQNIQRSLLESRPQIVHFTGYGSASSDND